MLNIQIDHSPECGEIIVYSVNNKEYAINRAAGTAEGKYWVEMFDQCLGGLTTGVMDDFGQLVMKKVL